MACSLFISDLHLDISRPEMDRVFTGFLSGPARDCSTLYILGDLFEVWIGDDDPDPSKHAIIESIRACADSGVRIFIMHGNRDFLIGDTFAGACNCTLLEDPTVIDLHGTPTLLTHGDQLCTDDIEYQRFRQTVRSTEWRATFLSKPIEERTRIARALRDASHESISGKPAEIMDINPDALRDLAARYSVSRIIHGHTHRPAVHHQVFGDLDIYRHVLADWHTGGSGLRHENGALTPFEL